MAQPIRLPNQEGKQVPDVTWPVRIGGGCKKMSS
jgi:hypothetical protein